MSGVSAVNMLSLLCAFIYRFVTVLVIQMYVVIAATAETASVFSGFPHLLERP